MGKSGGSALRRQRERVRRDWRTATALRHRRHCPAAATARFYRRLLPCSGSGRSPAWLAVHPARRRCATPRIACPRHPDASLRPQDASLIDRDASLMRRDASLMRRDASLMHRDASLMRRDASLMHQDASLMRRDASLMRQDASLMRQDASLGDQDASLRRPGNHLEAWASGRRDQSRRAKSWPTRRECAARSNAFGSKSSPSHSRMRA